METKVIVMPSFTISASKRNEMFYHINRVLCDKRSWIHSPEFIITGILTSEERRLRKEASNSGSAIRIYPRNTAEIQSLFPDNVDAQNGYSITNMLTKKIYLNTDRFFSLDSRSGFSNLEEYQNYIINHEFGHALRLFHPEMPDTRNSELSRVMSQQTGGKHLLQGYRSNGWPLPEEHALLQDLMKQRSLDDGSCILL